MPAAWLSPHGLPRSQMTTDLNSSAPSPTQSAQACRGNSRPRHLGMLDVTVRARDRRLVGLDHRVGVEPVKRARREAVAGTGLGEHRGTCGRLMVRVMAQATPPVAEVADGLGVLVTEHAGHRIPPADGAICAGERGDQRAVDSAAVASQRAEAVAHEMHAHGVADGRRESAEQRPEAVAADDAGPVLHLVVAQRPERLAGISGNAARFDYEVFLLTRIREAHDAAREYHRRTGPVSQLTQRLHQVIAGYAAAAGIAWGSGAPHDSDRGRAQRGQP